MGKVDYKKELKELYNTPSKEPVVIQVPDMNFIMIDASGDPRNTEVFEEVVGALYGVAYPIKFAVKKESQDFDYGVMPLEGLWWCDDIKEFSMDNRQDWKWTLMIMQPEVVTEDHFKKAVQDAAKKGVKSVERLRFEKLPGCKAAQVMHIGPYSEEPPTIEKLHAYIKANGYSLTAKHWEIYLGDPRKAAPGKVKDHYPTANRVS